MPSLVPSLKRRLKLWLLSADRSPAINAVGRALSRLSPESLSTEEKAWVDRIEALRREIYQSATEIVKVDYGAGAAESARDRDEMLAGVGTAGRVGEIARLTSKPPFWALVLFRLVRERRPVSCIEMGTSMGISACYQSAALACNGAGRFVTLEGDPGIATLARTHFAKIGLKEIEVVVGRFADTLGGVLRERQPVDYVFVDGHHDEVATVEYFEAIKPFLAPSALLVFDDIAWSDGMKRAWRKIGDDPDVSLAIDLEGMGICIVEKGAQKRRNIWVPVEDWARDWDHRLGLV